MKLRTAVLTAIATLMLATVSHATSALSAVARLDNGGNNGAEPTNYNVDVLFSGNMDANTALNPANYSISGSTITGATFFTDATNVAYSNMVILTLAAPLNTSFTLNLSANVLDGQGNPVSNSSVSGTVDSLQSIDMPVPNPGGKTFSTGPGSYVVDASGNDIWGINDSFRFDYEPKTNDFDVVVKVTSVVGADAWTKTGLIVRETIDPNDGGSRMMFVGSTPPWLPLTQDGSRGIYDITGSWRDAPDFPAANGGTVPFSFCGGDFNTPPSYPNAWFRLTRHVTATNDLYTGYLSSDGTNWYTFEYWDAAQDNINGDAAKFGSVVYVGIASCAHSGTNLMTASYSNFGDYVAPSNPPPPAIPSVLSAVARLDNGGNQGTEPTNYYVDVLFDQAMVASSAENPANYSISGATITGATFFTNNAHVALSNMVILALTAPLNTSFTLHLTANVVNGLGNPVSNSSVSGTVDPLQSVDIPGDGTLPIAVPGTTFSAGPGSYVVDASGADIYNQQDSFRFDYEPKTNDFDIVVQLASMLPADGWTKCGLMAREMIDPNNGSSSGGSRQICIARTANSYPTVDASAWVNDITGDWRYATDAGAGNPNNGNISYYYGDFNIRPGGTSYWFRLTRHLTATNDLYTGYCSPDGTTWTQFEYWDAANDTNNPAPLPSVIYVGIASCAHIYPGVTPPDAQVTGTYANFGDYKSTLTISRSGASVIITWPLGTTLQSATSLTGPWADVPSATSPYTNAPTGQVFYRTRE